MSAKWPGFSDEQARVIDALVSRFQAELAALRAPDRVLDRRGARAAIRPRPGDVVRTQVDDVVVLPHPRSARGHAPVIILVESTPVRVLAESGTVNDVDSVEVTATGAMTWYSTGTEWWGSAVGGSSGSGGADPDAEYVLGVADAGLPNARVATASTEIAPNVGTPSVISWVLNAASVAYSKLANLTGLSVLGRAANSSGTMAAITASLARQVLRANDAGTSLEWGNPVEAQEAGVARGDVHTLDFHQARVSVASGVATIGPPTTIVVTESGTLNNYVLPSALRHGDTLAIVCSPSDVTLTGIAGGTPGFGFYLNVSGAAARVLTVVDESSSSTATNRISLAQDLDSRNPPGSTFWVSYGATRWSIADAQFIEGFDAAGSSQGFSRSVRATSTTSIIGTLVKSSNQLHLSYQRAAITGDVMVAQNSNTATIPNNTVTNAKAADMAANTVKANPTASTADPQDLAIAANGVPFRVGSANLASHAPGPHQVLASDGDGETDWRDAGTLLDATHYILRDDFSGGEQGFSSGTYGETGWKRVRNTDAGEEIVGVPDEVGHPGVVGLSLTTDTVDAIVALVRGHNDFTAEVGRIAHGDLDFFEFVVRVPSFQADTGAQFQVGFGADPLDDDNDGEGVYFSLNVDTNGEPWIGVCRTGGSSDTTPTLVAGSVNWVRLTARKTATHWMFSANGGDEEAVPLSNAPADSVLLGAFARIRRLTTGGGVHLLRVDFVRAHGTLDR